MARDGWHCIRGRDVYVENDRIVRAMKKDPNGSDVPAQVYRWSCRHRYWCNAGGCLFSTFRAAMYSGGPYEVM